MNDLSSRILLEVFLEVVASKFKDELVTIKFLVVSTCHLNIGEVFAQAESGDQSRYSRLGIRKNLF